MKHKLSVLKYSISTLLVAAALCLLRLPSYSMKAGAPEPTPSPTVDIITKLQPYQTPNVEPSRSHGSLLEKAPLSSGTEESLTSALDQQTFYAIADATVLQGYPSQNLGHTTDMWAGYDEYLEPDGQIARSLVEFDIASLPPSQDITEATLRVCLVGSWDFPDTSRTIRTWRITSNWSESNVTWNNRPGYGGAYGSKSIASGAWGWYEFDVTDLVSAWYDGTYTNHGIMLRGPEVSGYDSSWRAFGTRESDDTPELVIEYAPSSAAPNMPSNPSPADGAMGVSINTDLGWTGGDPDPGDTVTYDVYFETNDSTPDDLICDDVPTPACDPGTLAQGARYYWHVVATDNHGASTTGATWDFTCVGNTPPTISGLPDQTVAMNSSADNAIDLWDYADDVEDADTDLTFTISNSPVACAGVTIDSNRYIDINPDSGWTGATDVEIQVRDIGGLTNTDTFHVTVTGGTIYLPLVTKRWPPIPDTPVLNASSNPEGDGNYPVSWSAADLADSYTLQEDDNSSFSSATTAYSGSGTSWNKIGKAAGTYYYRVQANNSWGSSGWSNVRSVTVRSSCIPDPPGESDNIDDALTVCSGQAVSGRVSDDDWDDVYKIVARANQLLTISMSGSGGDADLYLYPPGTTDVNTDPCVDWSENDENDEFIQHTVLEGGFGISTSTPTKAQPNTK